MRAWELYETGGGNTRSSRKPIVSLKHINHLKRLKAARRADEEQRQRLWSLMYADAATEQHSLDEREVDLDAREQELRLRELQADIGEAIAKAEISQQRKDHLYQMAMREIGRHRKRPEQLHLDIDPRSNKPGRRRVKQKSADISTI